MEKGIYVLSRNRPFLSLVSVIAGAVLDASDNDGVPTKCPGNASNVVDSVLRVLDAADKYEDEVLQQLVEPLKHKLKVAAAELRQSCTVSVMHAVLSNSIQLLALLEEFEEDYTKKLHHSVLLSLQELEGMNKSDVDDDVQPLVETLQCVPPLIRHLQARLEVTTEKSCYLKFHSAAGMSKFYVQFLGQTYRQAAKHPSSPSIKVLKTFALQLVCTCLTKMCNAICVPDTQRQVLMGNFVDAMDQVTAQHVA
ncbi:uncharacterized protein LOC135379211 [Ornithodoros turicata]|uniref:uncharacterized protein LOC135379211 n=1 Tax=Ornithodoros turicata TaxID=34597 RepID=UPI003138C958